VKHFVVVGLGYGDESKGGIVDWACEKAGPFNAVIRFNGGCQAGHNVVRPSGTHHEFSQFGSGTFSGVPTILSRYMMVEPLSFFREAEALEEKIGFDPIPMVSVDRECLVTTPWHVAYNDNQEALNGHGTCGRGVGATARFALEHPDDALRVGDLRDSNVLRRKLLALEEWAGPTLLEVNADYVEHVYRYFANRVILCDRAHLEWIVRTRRCVFEGAQGVLLDEWKGFHPHTTWSTTTFDNAVEITGDGDILRIGVVRTYTTRHGVGPHPTAGHGPQREILEEPHNHDSGSQGRFRIGAFDAVAHRYAIKACGRVDVLAVTHLDAVRHPLEFCDSYADGWTPKLGSHHDLAHQEEMTQRMMTAAPLLTADRTPDTLALIGDLLGVTIGIASGGPTADDKRSLLHLVGV
jgi:adenylosuccinate synthase